MYIKDGVPVKPLEIDETDGMLCKYCDTLPVTGSPNGPIFCNQDCTTPYDYYLEEFGEAHPLWDVDKAITLWQPWAYLLVQGIKKFETRGWPTKYRGPLAIHASAMSFKRVLKQTFPLHEWTYHPDHYAKEEFIIRMGDAMKMDANQVESFFIGLKYGAVIGYGQLIGCHEIEEMENREEGCRIVDAKGNPVYVTPQDNEYYMGGWSHGRYAWEFDAMTILDEPVPIKGAQGLWNLKIPA
jgi:hypothetical protein